MLISDFDFTLPEELIAQYPLENRDSAKMMIVNRQTDSYNSSTFGELINQLSPGDIVVFNDTKVIPARIFGNKILADGELGANIELMLTEELDSGNWLGFARPGKRLKVGTEVVLPDGNTFEIIQKFDDGSCEVKFSHADVLAILDACGHVPLPPYIDRPDEESDKYEYQTIFADKAGAVAAPTAGLHFTDDMLDKIRKKGIGLANVTLHVGAGTFRPVVVENVNDHKMHFERYELTADVADKINKTRKNGGRVFAIGTTSLRVLESCWSDEESALIAGSGRTDIFIYPPYKVKSIDAILTNFHLPKSTLLMLVSAFANNDLIMRAYQQAIDEKFRFFSYGDCMLIV